MALTRCEILWNHSDEKKTKIKRYTRLFIDEIGMKESEVKYLLRNNDKIFEIDENRILQNIRICKSQKIDVLRNENDIEFLFLNEEVLTSRILILREIGAKYINTAMIMSLASNVPMILFKAFTGISKDEDVAKNLYSYLHKPPSDIPPLENINDYMTVSYFRQRCLSHYLQWRFQLSNTSEKKINIVASRLKNKTFSSIKYSFDVLHEDGKMPIQKIWKYSCLQKSSENDLKILLNEIRTICDISFVELLEIDPALHKMRLKNVICLKKCLEEHNIEREQIKNCPKILLLDEIDFLKEWNLITTSPKLKVFLKHPLVLRIFMQNDRINNRLEYLRYLNVSHVNMDYLIKTPDDFERCIKSGIFKYRAKDINMTLSRHSGINPARVEKLLSIHPFWRRIELFSICNTLNYLKSKFNIADIENNLYLILYHKDKVESVLENLIHENKLLDDSNRYTSSQLLALCAYEIEKKFNFTGDGVWNTNNQQQLLITHE
ncbi:hypothetical protein PV325_012482 [Microctonus aethiopoides]|nr:hypothetical protein PV325_012482 [Microctonus aethiopoides]